MQIYLQIGYLTTIKSHCLILSMRKLEDLTGKKFGRLTVVCQDGFNLQKNGTLKVRLWKCLCDCQLNVPESERNYIYVQGGHLKSGHTKSCGCHKRESVSKTNKIEVYENFCIGTDSNGKKFSFDIEDLDKVKRLCWRVNKYGYVVAFTRDGYKNRKSIVLHRYLLDFYDKNMTVDHINHITVDNRKINLRICTYSENNFNHKLFKKNKTGFTGIRKINENAWQVGITINGKYTTVGTYKTLDEAISIRKEQENKYYAEFSYENSIKKSIEDKDYESLMQKLWC